MWTRQRSAWCASDTNKHQRRPQINSSLPMCWVAAEHLAWTSDKTCGEAFFVEPLLYKILWHVHFFKYAFFFLRHILQDVATSETWLYTACCCNSSGLRPESSGDHGLSHLHSSKAAGCNSKIIASSTTSRKAWCASYLHDSSLWGWQLNQYFTAIYHQLTLQLLLLLYILA